MKKTLLVLSAIATLFAFVSCGGGNSTEPDGPAGSDTNTPADTPATAVSIDLSGAEVGLISSYGSTPSIVEEDGAKVLKISAAGNYASWKIVLPQAIDISGKKIKLTVKFEGYSTGDNTFKVAFLSDETHGSEFTNETAGFEFDSEYKTIEVALSDLVVQWSSDDSITAADFSAIKQINIVPQTGTGTIFIKNIEFVN